MSCEEETSQQEIKNVIEKKRKIFWTRMLTILLEKNIKERVLEKRWQYHKRGVFREQIYNEVLNFLP